MNAVQAKLRLLKTVKWRINDNDKSYVKYFFKELYLLETQQSFPSRKCNDRH